MNTSNYDQLKEGDIVTVKIKDVTLDGVFETKRAVTPSHPLYDYCVIRVGRSCITVHRGKLQ